MRSSYSQRWNEGWTHRQELSALTFGVIGAGAIGQQVIKVANAFGAKVIAYNRSIKDVPDCEFLPLDDVMKQSDVIIHLPMNAENKRFYRR